MEIPDVLVVTKADLGRVAQRAEADLRAALSSLGTADTPVVSVSSAATSSATPAGRRSTSPTVA
jgi:LAO/AO transport system kinase